MLIKLTEKCMMGCSHCISNCTSRGRDMSLETFYDVLAFYEKMSHGKNVFIFSGGEPSENPMFSIMVSIAIERLGRGHLIFIATNGMWIESDPDSCRMLLDYAVRKNVTLRIQITSDPRYYPHKVRIPYDIASRREVFIGYCSTLAPQGRAVLNFERSQFTSHSPGCFNMLFAAKQAYIKGYNLKNFFNNLLVHGKVCVPQISINGEIKAGESDLCPAVSSIYDTDENIFRNLAVFSCKNCKIGYEFLKEYHYDNYILNMQLDEAVSLIVKD